MKFIVNLGNRFMFLPVKNEVYNMSLKILHQKTWEWIFIEKVKVVMKTIINHYKNVWKGDSFSIQILEKIEGDTFINDHRNFAVQKLCLQWENYWRKKVDTIYPYGLNEKAKNSKLE